jgi:hypothetical protein
MTTNANETSLRFHAPRSHVVRDVAFFLAPLLLAGYFVAQFASPSSSSRPAPTPSASASMLPNARA